MTRSGWIAGLAVLALATSSCSDSKSEKTQTRPRILSTEVSALVRKSIVNQGGFIAVQTDILKDHVFMPPETPWQVHCGISGFKVVFTPDVEVVFSVGRPEGDECAILAHAAAHTVAMIARGN
jgi:hypothetical protein